MLHVHLHNLCMSLVASRKSDSSRGLGKIRWYKKGLHATFFYTFLLTTLRISIYRETWLCVRSLSRCTREFFVRIFLTFSNVFFEKRKHIHPRSNMHFRLLCIILYQKPCSLLEAEPNKKKRSLPQICYLIPRVILNKWFIKLSIVGNKVTNRLRNSLESSIIMCCMSLKRTMVFPSLLSWLMVLIYC
jgi:hypothetical protein